MGQSGSFRGDLLIAIGLLLHLLPRSSAIFNALSFSRCRKRTKKSRDFGFGADSAQIAPPLSYKFSDGGVMETKSDWYRARAADCAALAERAPDLPTKAVYEQMVQDWLRLAELTDRRDAE
jgi:hypothetical protein